MVLTAIRPMLPLVADRVEPALNPNQPNASSRVPNMTMGMWCPKMGRGLPMGSYLPEARPEHPGHDQPKDAALQMNDGRAGKVHGAVPQSGS